MCRRTVYGWLVAGMPYGWLVTGMPGTCGICVYSDVDVVDDDDDDCGELEWQGEEKGEEK